MSSLNLYIALHDDLLLLTLNLLLSLCRADLHLSLKDFIFFMLLCKLRLNLLEQLLLNHSPEGILHSVARGLESTEASA